MHNVVCLFKNDCKRLVSNVVTVIIVLGLIALPSIFSWYNIIACWDVFGNTGNLTVAVANSDEGYESDLVPLRINIGDRITSALRANDQLDWVFTDEEDAVDGARSGRYYAAVVIPASFSADMMSFYSDDMEHASITYYSNQKKSAIAPKVTDQGADQVSAQVNQVFAETVSEIALGISSTLLDYADRSDAGGRIGDLAQHAVQLGSQLDDAADTLDAYSSALQSAQQLIGSAENLMARAGDAAGAIAASTAGARQAADEAARQMDASAGMLSEAIAQESASIDQLPASVEAAFNDNAAAAATAEQLLRDQAAVMAAIGDAVRAEALTNAADTVAAANASAQAKREEAGRLVAEARQSLNGAKVEYDQQLKPSLDQLAAMASQADESIAAGAGTIEGARRELDSAAGSLSQSLADSRQKIDAASGELRQASDELTRLGNGIQQALASDDAAALRAVIGSDPKALATAIAAPVKLGRHALYPVDNFGSAMSPLYTTLALWIGALLLMVSLRVVPTARAIADLEEPTPRQLFVGRFCTIGMLSLMQSTTISVGNLLFLGVQATHPLLYVLCFWVSGLVFAFIIYTMVALFANLGKALGVILLIVQVAGGGGSFPLQLLPPFFQNMSPYLPISHAVNAMRAAMFGIFQGDFWIELGTLLLFVIPFALLGLVLQKPFSLIVPRFVERVEQSKLI